VFLHALFAVTHANLSRVGGAFQKILSLDNAQEVVNIHLRENPMLRSSAANFIWLQILLFLILDCDARGPDNLWLRSGIPKGILVEAAAKLGYYIAKTFEQLVIEVADIHDLDSDINLARRGWVVTSVLCRWHTFGVADKDVIGSYEFGSFTDQKILGLASAQVAGEYNYANNFQ
jgi:hypothetical protein